MESIKQQIQRERQNPNLENTLDIQKLLEKSNGTSYLQNKTLDGICKEVMDMVNNTFPQTIHSNISMIYKLSEYRFVENICDLHKGKHIRWIRLSYAESPKLTNGGIVTDIKFNDNGIHVLCKSNNHRFIQYKFDDCLTFQKLNDDELMILNFCGLHNENHAV